MWISVFDAFTPGYTMKGMAKATVYCLGVSVFLGLLFSASFASAQTSASVDLQALVKQLQAQIDALQAQVKELKSQLAVTQGGSALASQEQQQQPTVSKQEVAAFPERESGATEKSETLFVIVKSLQRGSRGDEVRRLQEFLSRFSDIYPQGLITGFYGPATEAAVRKFQQKHGFEQVGFLGPRTLARINELMTGEAARSGVIPPGLLRASGVAMGLGTAAIPVPAGATSTVTPGITGIPAAVATSSFSSAILATTSPATPASTPAIPAISAIPAQSIGQTGTTTIPAIPAVLAAASFATTTTATTTTATTTVSTAPILKITAPNGGEQWSAGNVYTIAWTTTGANAAAVNIDLYKSGIYHSSIVTNSTNTGSIVWTVPAGIASGSDYTIRVYTSFFFNNFDESDGPINIAVPVATPGAPPIGYWKFDGNGSNEIAGSPSAVAVGGAVFRASGGKFGGHLYMPSGNDYAKIPYNSMFNLQNFTVEFWFRQRANQGFNQNLISKGAPPNNYNFNIFRNLWNQFNNGAVIAGSTAAGTGYWHQVSNQNEPPHNAWHHVVYTKTTEGAAYYIDGALISARNYAADRSPEYAGPVRTPAVDIIIGNPAPDTDIDNLRIYNYALSRGEVLYNLEQVPGVAAPPPPQDTAPPVISNIQATNITATSAVVSWITDEPSDSQVLYDSPNTTFTVGTTPDPARVTNHSVLLSGLASSLTYTYRVQSKDAAGNPATSASQTFTTAATAPSCVGPYHVLASDGRCVWSCGIGTTPSNSSNECVCQSGYTESGADQFGRRVCSQPGIPQVQGLTATVSGNSVTLSWQGVAGMSNFSTYNIHRGTSADFVPIMNLGANLLTQSPLLSYTDSNLAVGTYYYKVAAQDTSGNVGPASAAASAQVVSSGYAFTIRGRLANAITKEPVTNSNLYIWNWKGSTRRDFPLQPDGSFAINLTADDLANASATYVNAVHNYSKACYDQSSFSVYKTSSGAVDYVNVQETSGDHNTTRRVTPAGGEANIGDMLAWPVTGFSLTSDIPVKFEGSYANGRSGGGNINYRTSHGFSTFMPVNTSMAIALTDQAGTRYVSPYVTYGLSQHCNQVSLNYAGGQFSWSPPGTVSVGGASPSLAALLKSIGAILSEMERTVRGLAR